LKQGQEPASGKLQGKQARAAKLAGKARPRSTNTIDQHTIGSITLPNQVIMLAPSCPRQPARTFFWVPKTEGRNHPRAEE
jgi:hypothetical protein